MKVSDAMLTAYADGELDATARESVERAMSEDPEVARRVAQHLALRQRVQAAFAAELSEPIPVRLLAAARPVPANSGGAQHSNVVVLREARAAITRQPAAAQTEAQRASDATGRAASWRPLGSIAAGVLLGLGIGYGLWQQSGDIVRTAGGSLVAGGRLARSLAGQLAAEQTAASPVHLGVSFLAKSGDYCRSFVLAGNEAPSGVACFRAGQWRINALAQGPASSAPEYRTAGSAISPLVLKSMEQDIQGEPLDQAGEAAARQHGWRATMSVKPVSR